MNKETSEREVGNRAFPDLPRAITSFGAAVVDDSIYLYGGHHGRAHHYSLTGQSGELLQLNLRGPLAWRVVATGPKLQGLALVTYGGKLYCIGGFTARNKDDEDQDLWSVPDFAQFDPRRREWEQLPSMPTPRSSFDAVVAGDHLYVVGGWAMQGGEKTVWQDTVYTVDLSQRVLKWSLVAEPPFQRRALSAGAFNGRVYVIGGMQPDGKVTTRTAVFHPEADAWMEGPDLPGDDMEGFGAACFPAGDRLYVSTASGKLLRLSSDGKSWQTAKELQTGRFFHRMLPIDRHHLVILGGASMKTGSFSEIEVVKIGPPSNFI